MMLIASVELVVPASNRTPGAFSGGLASDKHNVLHRLVLVHFVRIHYSSHVTNRTALESFLVTHPEASMRTVLVHVLRSEFAQGVRSDLGRSSPIKRIGVMVRDGSLTVGRQVREWFQAGINPHTLAGGYVTILGRDYSLAARPE